MNQKRAAIYVRVSTEDQNTGSQESAVRNYAMSRGWVIHRVYRDHGVSGAAINRPGLDALMKDARRRAFDVVLVWKFDRFGRNLTHLIRGLETLRALKIDFVSFTEAIDTSLPSGELVFQIFGAVAQFERALIGERVRAGLKHARETGKVLGRPPLRALKSMEISQLRRERREGKLPFRTLATRYGISVWTAHRLCDRRKEPR